MSDTGLVQQFPLGEWVKPGQLKAGDEVGLNEFWVPLLAVVESKGQFLLVMDSDVEGIIEGFKAWPEESWYRRKI